MILRKLISSFLTIFIVKGITYMYGNLREKI